MNCAVETKAPPNQDTVIEFQLSKIIPVIMGPDIFKAVKGFFVDSGVGQRVGGRWLPTFGRNLLIRL